MKKDWCIVMVRVALTGCMAMGWWGMWYPEFAMPADTYRIVQEDGTEYAVDSEQYSEEAVWKAVMEAGPERIRVRSKLLERITDYVNKDK